MKPSEVRVANPSKAVIALVALVAIVILMAIDRIEGQAGVGLLGLIVGYSVGNGVGAASGKQITPIFDNKKNLAEEDE